MPTEAQMTNMRKNTVNTLILIQRGQRQILFVLFWNFLKNIKIVEGKTRADSRADIFLIFSILNI